VFLRVMLIKQSYRIE